MFVYIGINIYIVLHIVLQMYFHTGKCEYVLFEKIRTSSVGGKGVLDFIKH